MAKNFANRVHPAPTEAHAIHILRGRLLDSTLDARCVLALTDAIIALHRDRGPR